MEVSLSTVCGVISGTLQGSVLGSDLFAVVINLLQRKFKLLAAGFVDNLKFVADIKIYSRETVQEQINRITYWSEWSSYEIVYKEECRVAC